MNVSSGPASDWFVFQRLQEVESASRVNLLRAIAVVLFFSVVLFNYLSSEPTAEQTRYMWSSARICGIWILLSALIAAALKMKVFPPIFKFATTACDALLLTAIAAVGAKAESTLVIAFFIIIASTYLRVSVPLVFFGTLLCVLGYLTLVYNTPHFWVRPDGVEFPYVEVFRTVAGMLIMGAIGWQLCRGSRSALEKSMRYARSEAKV